MLIDISSNECSSLVEAIETTHLPIKIALWKLHNKIKENDFSKAFILTDTQKKLSEDIFKDKGNISYEFIPNGIGYSVKIKVLKTGEIIDITDIDTW